MSEACSKSDIVVDSVTCCCRAAATTETIPIHVNKIKISNETAIHFPLCLGRMMQMFPRYASNNFLFDEG